MSESEPQTLLQRLGRRRNAALAAVALLAVGGGAGAVAMKASRPPVTMAPALPVTIKSLASDGIVTIKGQVAEIYGNKFIMADASGRALVDTGREGEQGLVTAGEPVLVQGHFDHGFVRAAFLVGPDGKVVALGPLGGPPHGHHGGRHGPDGGPGGRDGGPDGPDGPPPPPPGADRGNDAPPPPPAPAAGAH